MGSENQENLSLDYQSMMYEGVVYPTVHQDRGPQRVERKAHPTIQRHCHRNVSKMWNNLDAADRTDSAG
jgi:hypothetical protein